MQVPQDLANTGRALNLTAAAGIIQRAAGQAAQDAQVIHNSHTELKEQ
jgi:ABC-type metal ion transport system substrate-binding protein